MNWEKPVNKRLIPLLLLAIAIPASAKEKEQIKVEVVSTDTREFKSGEWKGGRRFNVVFAMNTIIKGEHVKLECYENRKGCTALTPGVYDAEFDGKSVWTTSELPLTHKQVREHWKVAGGW
jgi:hypothetical protein